jgi:hypothetical protein
MHRNVFHRDEETGEIVRIVVDQKAYQLGDGSILVLDASEQPPEGGVVLTEAQIAELATKPDEPNELP